jgi:hypothetical protein
MTNHVRMRRKREVGGSASARDHVVHIPIRHRAAALGDEHIRAGGVVSHGEVFAGLSALDLESGVRS